MTSLEPPPKGSQGSRADRRLCDRSPRSVARSVRVADARSERAGLRNYPIHNRTLPRGRVCTMSARTPAMRALLPQPSRVLRSRRRTICADEIWSARSARIGLFRTWRRATGRYGHCRYGANSFIYTEPTSAAIAIDWSTPRMAQTWAPASRDPWPSLSCTASHWSKPCGMSPT